MLRRLSVNYGPDGADDVPHGAACLSVTQLTMHARHASSAAHNLSAFQACILQVCSPSQIAVRLTRARQFRSRLWTAGELVAVLDIPLLFETKLDAECDEVH